MHELLVIVPSRGRPERLDGMLEVALATSGDGTRFAVALDEDDPALLWYHPPREDPERVTWTTGPRDTLAGWTNELAMRGLDAGYRAFASFGDDHIPRTPAWDTALLAAIGGMGGTGFAYPDDKRRTDIPEAVVVSADIVRALGWMCEPSLDHFYIDNTWADLGNGAGCIRFCPDVIVEHMHYITRGGVERDATYAEAEERMGADQQSYERWRAERMTADINTIRALRREADE